MSKNNSNSSVSLSETIMNQKRAMVARRQAAVNNGGSNGKQSLIDAWRSAAQVLVACSPEPLHYEELGARAVANGYRGTGATPPQNTIYAACKQEAEAEGGTLFAFYPGGVFGLLRDAEAHTPEVIDAAKPKRSRAARQVAEVAGMSLEELLG